MRAISSIFLFLFCVFAIAKAQADIPMAQDSVVIKSNNCTATVTSHHDTAMFEPSNHDFEPSRKKLSWWRRVIRGFSKIDTNYIRPQAYNYTVMLQNTTSFEGYSLRFDNGNSVRFSPRPSIKLGPYVGWRWIFLGYTLDLRATGGGARQAINLSLYANQVGIDLFYRKSGDNYRVHRVGLFSGYDASLMHNIDFNGFSSSERGFNFYYIFNHKKFSYPAAYSQSTVQKKSCGTALAGVSYSRHKLKIDWAEFYRLLDERVGEGTAAANMDTTIHSANVNYTDFSLSGGYAYNWVFAKNWLFDISLQLALGYKQSHSDVSNRKRGLFRDFDFHNFNVDGVSRVALVWNNMRWYAGASAIFHTYNYKRNRFRSNTTFGNINVYVGYNFGRKK